MQGMQGIQDLPPLRGGGLSHGRIGVAGILTAQVPITGQVVSSTTGVCTVVPGTMGLTIVARRTRVVVTKQPAAVVEVTTASEAEVEMSCQQRIAL